MTGPQGRPPGGPPGMADAAFKPGPPKALGRALRYLKPYWRSATVAILGLLFYAGAMLVSPQMVRYAIDNGIAAASIAGVIAGTVGLLITAGVRGLSSFLQTYGSERAA